MWHSTDIMSRKHSASNSDTLSMTAPAHTHSRVEATATDSVQKDLTLRAAENVDGLEHVMELHRVELQVLGSLHIAADHHGEIGRV